MYHGVSDLDSAYCDLKYDQARLVQYGQMLGQTNGTVHMSCRIQ